MRLQSFAAVSRVLAIGVLCAFGVEMLATLAGAAAHLPQTVCPASPGGAGQQSPALPPEPIVAIDSPEPGSTVRGSVAVRGWAVDPNFPPGPGRGINPRD